MGFEADTSENDRNMHIIFDFVFVLDCIDS